MTDEAVQISITIRVTKREQRIERKVRIEDLKETIQGIAIETGQEALGMGIKELDDRIAEKLPKGWQNVGTEERWLVSSIGAVRYKRRIYLDEKFPQTENPACGKKLSHYNINIARRN